MEKALRLFFWSSMVFENKIKENYGDLLSPYIVEQVSKRFVRFYNAPKHSKKWFQQRYIMAIGSILSYASNNALVWGSGIISKMDIIKGGTFYAVRGPLSRKRILEQGHSCPAFYGDPALLLPKFYTPAVEKTFDYGIIPHYVDYKFVAKNNVGNSNIAIIDLMTNDHFKTTDEIVKCKRVISSSLHGVIVAHAYGIPAIWVQFSNKLSGDNVKFEDYFLSVGLQPYQGEIMGNEFSMAVIEKLFQKYPSLPELDLIVELQEGLIKAFPEL